MDYFIVLLDLEVIKVESMSYDILCQISDFLVARRERDKELLRVVESEIYDRHFEAARDRVMRKSVSEVKNEVK